MNKFRLHQLTLKNHPVLDDCNMVFCDDEEDYEHDVAPSIYSSVIIGANGIGKSFILKAISDIFIYLYSIKSAQEEKIRSLGYRFTIAYSYRGSLYRITTIDTAPFKVSGRRIIDQMQCSYNGTPVGLHMCELPDVVVASAMTVSDKFTVKSSEFYRYQGIRNENSPSTTGTRTLVRKAVAGLIQCLKTKGGYREEVTRLLEVLGFGRSLRIQYDIRHKEVFLNEDMTPEHLCDIFDNQSEYFPRRQSELWGTTYFTSIRNNPSSLEQISDFFRRASRYPKSGHCDLDYDFFEDRILEDADAVKLLSKLDILSFPTLLITKYGQTYEFINSSSGETHILCQMIGILSEIKECGLVLIDEPETSSHPNWQVSYIGWLKDIFQRYSSCHFVISTHSHFMLSDLRPETSSILALSKNQEGKLENIGSGVNTFCWSTDDILYRVFHVRNTRNYAFEQDIIRLCSMVSTRNTNKHELDELIQQLSSFELPGNDPLKEIVLSAKNYAETL